MNKIKKILIICTCLVLAICQINIQVFAENIIKEGTYSEKRYKEFEKNKNKWGPKAEIIYKKLLNAGATPAGACAMLGNITAESRLNPKAKNTQVGIHYGIVQWGGGRLTNLKKRKNYSTIEVQADFMIYEFTNKYSSYKNTWKKITTATGKDLIDTTDFIRKHYEVVGPASKYYRMEFAVDWYYYFKNSTITTESTMPSGSPTPSVSTDEEETANSTKVAINSTYTQDAKNALEFTYGVPSSYDVKIDSDKLVDSPDIPAIKVTIEDVLYSHSQLVNMNFLGEDTKTSTNATSTENTLIKKFWEFYRDSVRSLLRAILYISTASLVTLLIYIGLIVVKNSIFSGNDIPTPGEIFKAPVRGKFSRKLLDTFNPKDAKKEKELIQEWIKSTFLIALIVLIINLIGNFSTVLTDLIKGFQVEEKTILVYVQGNGDDVQDFYFKTKLEGYCLFMSQSDWGINGLKNFAFIFTGFLINILKWILYFLLFARMLLAGAFIAISPIIILINSFKKVSGEERPTTLKNWIKFFMFLALFRPVLGIVYYAIFNSNPYSFAKDPAFIIILYVIFGLVIYAYIRFAFWLDVDKIGKKVRK